MQDLSIVGMFAGPALETYARPAGISVHSLADWERVMDWWFERYARYAVAVKSQHAYSRDIDYQRVDRSVAEPIFGKILRKSAPVSAEERRQLEDHLFWAAVDRATEAGLPVKLHTGYYAGHNGMPLARVSRNANSAAELCRLSPETKFVFMHICYPFYEDLLAVAKHYTNAYVDLCWAWIINPIATKDFLKKYLLTVPAHKILTFGGDYIPVEPVVGHAILARRGISLALAELVEEGWLDGEETPDWWNRSCAAMRERFSGCRRRSEAWRLHHGGVWKWSLRSSNENSSNNCGRLSAKERSLKSRIFARPVIPTPVEPLIPIFYLGLKWSWLDVSATDVMVIGGSTILSIAGFSMILFTLLDL
jgi:predicted TIM-barrel fold metal-dependent hydrolase